MIIVVPSGVLGAAADFCNRGDLHSNNRIQYCLEFELSCTPRCMCYFPVAGLSRASVLDRSLFMSQIHLFRPILSFCGFARLPYALKMFLSSVGACMTPSMLGELSKFALQKSISFAFSSRSGFKTSDLRYSRSSQTNATGVRADRLSAPRGKGIRIEIMHGFCNTDGGRQAFLQKVSKASSFR